ncbi:hypothetical protein GCM10022207_88810 [Streptomyces lannensis]|uniref:Uncharacterized protein n=1 Tax=Streptomyces lannensis TaxID=766498 RepID=A0ABP7LTE1_9ACTN
MHADPHAGSNSLAVHGPWGPRPASGGERFEGEKSVMQQSKWERTSTVLRAIADGVRLAARCARGR